MKLEDLPNVLTIARIAAEGIGRMDGYAKVLGPDGPEKVGAWVWKQALENWPRSS